MAGALGVRLGGVNFYNSAAKVEPYIGDGVCQLEARHILERYPDCVCQFVSGIVIRNRFNRDVKTLEGGQ